MMKHYRPTSPGQRARRGVVYGVDAKRPEKSLISAMKGAVGRSHGRITSASRQRGAKKFYRIIDFKRDKYQ
ncbi:50S ribosomal protein L2, partial [candidate division WWE3 bacterium]|nr:50S ribosomal protein L2 [candidate division WWE3 bacterium]